MYLTRHETEEGPRWAVDGGLLPARLDLAWLLATPRAGIGEVLCASVGKERARGRLLAPVEPTSEVWAAGVTYRRSREAREEESAVRDVYAKVYDAERPELFFKALGSRVVGHQASIRVRDDSRWNVPEPELTLVVNSRAEIIGYCAGNDVSSRAIEGENPLYLPQAKVYDGSCALGPGILIADASELGRLAVRLSVERGGRGVFAGETTTSEIKRPFEELVAYLTRELSFPQGVFLMTGTGIVPGNDFSLQPGDVVRVGIGELTLENEVARSPRPAAH